MRRDQSWKERLTWRAEHQVFRQEVMAAAGDSWPQLREDILGFDAGRVDRLLAEHPELQAEWDEEDAAEVNAGDGDVGSAPYTAADGALADRLRSRDRLLDEVFLSEVERSATTGLHRLGADLRVVVGTGLVDYLEPETRVRGAVRQGAAVVELSVTHERPGQDSDLQVRLPVAKLVPSEGHLLRDRSTVTLVQLSREGQRDAVAQSWRARPLSPISRDDLAVAAVKAAEWGEMLHSPRDESPVTEPNPHAQQLLARAQAVRSAHTSGPVPAANRSTVGQSRSR